MPKASRKDWPRYYRERGGKAFWEPGQFAADYGFDKSAALGDAGAEAKAKAIGLNADLDKARERKKTGQPAARRYTSGTLGAFWTRFTDEAHSEAWAQMEPATREDYHRAWRYIEKHKTATGQRLADILFNKITPQISERFHVEIHPAHDNSKRDPKGEMKLTVGEAFRTLKIWRAILNALVDYRLIAAPAPIGRIENPAPVGRSGVWLHEELVAMSAVAWWWRANYPPDSWSKTFEWRGLACAIAIAN